MKLSRNSLHYKIYSFFAGAFPVVQEPDDICTYVKSIFGIIFGIFISCLGIALIYFFFFFIGVLVYIPWEMYDTLGHIFNYASWWETYILMPLLGVVILSIFVFVLFGIALTIEKLLSKSSETVCLFSTYIKNRNKICLKIEWEDE